MKKSTKLKIAIAGTALVAVAATGTAMAMTGSDSSAGNGQQQSAQQRSEQGNQNKQAAQDEQQDAIDVDGANVFPHSLGFDPTTKTFYTGSLKHGNVFAVDENGKIKTHVEDPALVSAQSVLTDKERNRLLVSNVDYGTADRSDKKNPFHVAGVGSYDLKTGKQHWCVDLRPVAGDGKPHLISDVTVAPDGTIYAVDELTPTVFRIDNDGNASVLVRSDLLKGTLDVPNFLDDLGMSAVEWVEGNQLIISMADGSLVRVPVDSPENAQRVNLSQRLGAPTAGMRQLDDGSIVAVSSGLLTGKPAQIQRVTPSNGWQDATVKVTDTVTDPVTSDVTEGPDGKTYALSGGLADLLAGKPNDGFTLTPVETD